MADSDIPSMLDESEEDEATVMWSREDFDLDGEPPPRAGSKAAIHPPPPPPPAESDGPPPSVGLDEAALFGDVLEPSELSASASMPVQPMVTADGKPSIAVADTEDVEPPKVPSLVAPAPSSSRTGLWVGLSLLAVAGLAVAAYLLRAHLGPLGELLDRISL